MDNEPTTLENILVKGGLFILAILTWLWIAWSVLKILNMGKGVYHG